MDVVATDRGKSYDRIALIGPPYDGWAACSHLSVYAAPGVYTLPVAYLFHRHSSHLYTELSKASSFKYTLPSTNPGSPQGLALVSRWLQNCITHHGAICTHGIKSRMPTRLVDVGPNDDSSTPNTMLITTGGQFGTYLALSYCWGAKPFFRLTTANQEDLHRHIPIEQLPNTIRDAIALTRHLGVRYLWVDSLCIIQGVDTIATQDWEAESRMMHAIYGGALLTISADAGADANAGLFQDRPRPSVPYAGLPYDQLTSAQPGSKEIFLGPDVPEHISRMEPLQQRGWTFQEAVLSGRILHYNSKELSWKCGSYAYRESHVHSLEQDEDPTSVISRVRLPQQLHQNWSTLVEEYSRRQLTYLTDRLPALDGLARLVSNEINAGYHFGHWEDQTLKLLWWKHLGRVVNGRSQHTRQETYRAPSWSWASVNGGIKFLDANQKDLLEGNIKRDGPCKLKKIDGTCLLLEGYCQSISTIRYKLEGEYYGGYDNFLPWAGFGPTVRTFIDDLSAIPKKHLKLPKDSPQELVDTCFFFISSHEGLILIPETSVPNKLKSIKLPGFRLKSLPFQTFRRIGAFIGYSSAKEKWSDKEPAKWTSITIV